MWYGEYGKKYFINHTSLMQEALAKRFVGAFFVVNLEVSMSKSILCPRCGRLILHHDEKGTLPVDGKCKTCDVLVIYHPLTDKTYIARVPQRQSSSGKRFY